MTHRFNFAQFLLVCVLAALCLFVEFRGSVFAATDVFEVRGIFIDETADSAAAAREKALRKAERHAFETLLNRVTDQSNHDQLPRLDDSEIAALVAGFSIVEEKTSSIRYIATLDFRFKAHAVRSVLENHGIRHTVSAAPPVVVVPVLIAANKGILWDHPNPWRDAWYEQSSDSTLVPTIVPPGDLEDIATIGVEHAIQGDTASLMALAQRFGTQDALVAVATVEPDAVGRLPQIEVKITHYSEGKQDVSKTKVFQGEPGESVVALLARASASVNADLQERWWSNTVVDSGQSGVVSAVIPVGSLSEWLIVRARLERIPIIREMEVVLLTREEVRINLHFVGGEESLSEALQRSDLELIRDGDMWIVRPVASLTPKQT